MRISDWSSDVCSSDLVQVLAAWLQRDVLGGSSFIELLEESDSSLSTIESSGGDGQEVWATILLLFGPSLALVFVAAGLARLFGAWHVGCALSLGYLLKDSLPVPCPLLVPWLAGPLPPGPGLPA